MRAFRPSWTQRQARALAAGMILAGLTVTASAGQAAASPDGAGPRGASSGGASPGSAAPGSASPAGASPGSASPGSASPAGAGSGSAGPGGASPGAASPGGVAGLRQVRYRGYTFGVPRSWEVVRESAHPGTCVRFDRHVVYLGAPGADESCPSWLVGTTEAVLIEPGPAATARTSVEDPESRQITVTAPGIRVLATFDASPAVLYTMLSGAGLPAPQLQPQNPALLDVAEGTAPPAAASPGGAPAPAAPAASPSGTVQPAAVQPAAVQPAAGQPAAGQVEGQAASPDAAVPVSAPLLPASVANYRGLGFDSCAAPSRAAMRAWMRHSPYGAVGIYIGGSDRACDQRNLTATWVRDEAAAGWRFFPMYAGPQAAFGELKSPESQGAKAAADAVAQAQKLGFGPRTPIYYDMEAYPAKKTGAALRFLSAWTAGLHRLNYLSGVYSSSRSGVIDLARQYSKHQYVMPDTIYDALWNGSKNVLDKVYGKQSWPLNHRLHQYSGNDRQKFGGVTIDVDEDYMHVGLPTPGGTVQPAPAAAAASVYYRGAGNRLWRTPRSGSGWGTAVSMGGSLSSAPSVVRTGASTTDVFYRGSGGDLWMVQRAGGRWQPGRDISLMGKLGSAPQAVAQPNGVIDVFWKGSADDHLWHGQYVPGQGWSGPQRLGGDLASGPAPVENRFGTIGVFWEGTGRSHSLWHVTRRVGSGWTRPASLGMGPLGGPPRATALPSGAFQVVWRGSTRPHHVWSAFLATGRRAQGPRDLGGSVSGVPVPSAALGTARVFYRGTDGRLWQLLYRTGGRWHPPAPLAEGVLATAPFTAASLGFGPFEVFWKGRAGSLWAASDAGHGWTGPQRAGSSVR